MTIARTFCRYSSVPSGRSACAALLLVVACVAPVVTTAQSPTAGAQALPTLVLPAVTVVAEKEPTPIGRVPASVTAVSGSRLEAAGVSVVSDAAWFAPNTFYSDLSARKISNARFRGIGSSPANPAVTTFVDGVPQLNANTANVELLDVEQVEFVRGARSALFGRNALGGVVNVTSRRPGLSRWHGRASAPLGTDAERGLTLSASGPIVSDRVGAAFSLGVSGRDGYSRNSITGNLLDDRSAVAARAQLEFVARGPWSVRFIAAGERNRDGDYTLGDLSSLRATPFTVARDFEGRTDRDIVSATVLARREGARVVFSSTTGVVDWRTVDETDLDYTPFPAATRKNREDATQVTQELRIASASGAPVRVSSRATMAWQAGVFLFSQAYSQDAVNALSPFVLSPQVPFAVASHSPQSSLDDAGVGFFGHTTTTVGERLDVAAGVRVDRERRDAVLRSFLEPAIFPESRVEATRTFTSASPSVSVSFRPGEGRLVYGSLARGYKAGGFNAASPTGAEAYGAEGAWYVEGGVKATAAGGRVAMTAALFAIDWTELQLNLPNPLVPGQFYIANVGGATSRGFEAEVQARVHSSLVALGAVGTTRARFSSGSVSSGVNVSGNRLPSTPRFTAMGGLELDRSMTSSLGVTARVDVVGYGAFHYDDLNTAHQDAYALTNLRAGVRARKMLFEVWVRNAFDTKYVPVAFAYDPSSAPSGFLGEPGRPRTAGVRVSVEF